MPSGPDLEKAGRDALRLDGRLDAAMLGPELHQILLGMARLRNVVSTLRIEGEVVDLEGARRALETNSAQSPAEEQSLRIAKEYTWVHATPAQKLPTFSVEYVTRLHKRLFTGVHEAASPGRLKTVRNGVGDAATGEMFFEATPPDRTRAELERLFEWFEEAEVRAPLTHGAVFFAEFEGIHPFHDGNGRVGRLLGFIALKRLGLENIALTPLDGRFYHTQSEYYEKLATTNPGKTLAPWTRYYADQVLKAYEIAIRRSDVKPILAGQTRASTRALLEWVLARDASPFAHGDYPNLDEYSTEAIQKSLGQLVEQGILAAEGERRGRRYRLSTEFLRRLYAGSFA